MKNRVLLIVFLIAACFISQQAFCEPTVVKVLSYNIQQSKNVSVGFVSSANGPLVSSILVSGEIDTETDTDWYYFDVSETGSLDISLLINGNADLDWFLYDESAKKQLSKGFTTLNPEEKSINVSSGKYYIKVNGYNGDRSGYTLTLTYP